MNSRTTQDAYCMLVKSAHGIVAMPLRSRAGATGRVVTINTREEKRAKVAVLSMPGHEYTSPSAPAKQDVQSILRSGYSAFALGVRMTLDAILALLGWPHPSRDNDPGPSAARPCHWERINLISRIWLTTNSAKAPAAGGSVLEFPAEQIRVDENVLDRTA
jgi:hypothetical protein